MYVCKLGKSRQGCLELTRWRKAHQSCWTLNDLYIQYTTRISLDSIGTSTPLLDRAKVSKPRSSQPAYPRLHPPPSTAPPTQHTDLGITQTIGVDRPAETKKKKKKKNQPSSQSAIPSRPVPRWLARFLMNSGRPS